MIWLQFILSFGLMNFTVPAQANQSSYLQKESDTAKALRKLNNKKHPGACKVLRENCSFAGFRRDGPSGSDMKNDCMNVLLAGGTVKRVHVPKGIVDACRAAKELP